MAQLSYPGVYVEEVSSGVRPIQGASTSIAAFVGMAEKGPINEAVRIFNFTEYQNLYGGFLNSSWLSHAVLQFFNNGGTQCYIVRATGDGTNTAELVLNDRGALAQPALPPQPSLRIQAKSPGIWGNSLAVVIADGTNDPTNEFNLSVFMEDELTPLETFENLSMQDGVYNFVETLTASSKYVRVTVQNTSNASRGSSLGSGAPLPLDGTGRTKFRISIDGDVYQEIDLQTAVTSGAVTALDTPQNIADAITAVVTGAGTLPGLTRIRATTSQTAFDNFTCTLVAGTQELLLTSGLAGLSSSVLVAPPANDLEDATGLLNLENTVETLGAAVTRPRNNPAGTPPDNYFLVGDHAVIGTEVSSVVAGADGDPATDNEFIAAFQSLNDKEDVSLLAVPGIGSEAVVGAGMNYCAIRPLSDCFFIGDMSQDDDTIESAKDFRDLLTPKNSYGAIYFPWVSMLDPTGQSPEPILAPPSGFVAGQYAKTDARRGVWKAPAGTESALGGAVGLAVNVTDVQQGILNPLHVNVIRQFASSGIVLWGARTITSDPEWNYIPVRRTSIFLRVSIYRGIQWAVFEPNDEDLWASLRLNIGAFMMTLFRQGAFQGSTPSAAFFVKCDSETTTQEDIDLGIVNVLVGFAPLKPAEFVVVKISQKAGQST